MLLRVDVGMTRLKGITTSRARRKNNCLLMSGAPDSYKNSMHNFSAFQ